MDRVLTLVALVTACLSGGCARLMMSESSLTERSPQVSCLVHADDLTTKSIVQDATRRAYSYFDIAKDGTVRRDTDFGRLLAKVTPENGGTRVQIWSYVVQSHLDDDAEAKKLWSEIRVALDSRKIEFDAR